MSSEHVGIEEARKRLGDLVTAAQQGADIVLTRNSKPAARIVAFKEPAMSNVITVDMIRSLEASVPHQGWALVYRDGEYDVEHLIHSRLGRLTNDREGLIVAQGNDLPDLTDPDDWEYDEDRVMTRLTDAGAQALVKALNGDDHAVDLDIERDAYDPETIHG